MNKIVLILLLLLSKFTYSQTSQIDERKNYIEEANKLTFTSLGNNDLLYYECNNDCSEIVLNISEKYWSSPMLGGGSLKYSKKQKQQTAITMSEQYTYLFYSKGFKTLIIKIEGLEPITKDLKLNR